VVRQVSFNYEIGKEGGDRVRALADLPGPQDERQHAMEDVDGCDEEEQDVGEVDGVVVKQMLAQVLADCHGCLCSLAHADAVQRALRCNVEGQVVVRFVSFNSYAIAVAV
jgi:hypothetical protein